MKLAVAAVVSLVLGIVLGYVVGRRTLESKWSRLSAEITSAVDEARV
jgi:hypothetical protein